MAICGDTSSDDKVADSVQCENLEDLKKKLIVTTKQVFCYSF